MVDVDVDVKETCFSVLTAEKWSERLIKGRAKSKTLTSNILSANDNRSKVTTVVARAGSGDSAGPTTDRQSDFLKDKILSAVYLKLSSDEARSKNVIVSGWWPVERMKTCLQASVQTICISIHLLSPPDDSVKHRPTEPNYFALF